jgi:hypothetical protein
MAGNESKRKIVGRKKRLQTRPEYKGNNVLVGHRQPFRLFTGSAAGGC